MVIDEAGAGDEEAASERLALLDGIPLLDATDPRIDTIADALLAAHLLPEKARSDAQHVATATVHNVDYLLTWNCKHIANAKILPRIHGVLADLAIPIPMVCTPEELLGDDTESN